jgi:hypothetical protein
MSPPRSPADPPEAGQTLTEVLKFESDNRLPPPGSVLTRTYKGENLQVKVLEDGFEFGEQTFKSLSAVAREITGTHCNGYHFFRLNKEVS